MEAIPHGQQVRCRRRILVLVATLGLCLPWALAAQSSEMVVIVHRENPVSQLTLLEVRNIYRGDRTLWKSGDAIEVLLPRPGSPAMRVLLESVFEMKSVSELGQYYLAAIFQQKISEAPPTVSTEESIQIVSRSKHALAIVPRASAVDQPGIKIIEVAGI